MNGGILIPGEVVWFVFGFLACLGLFVVWVAVQSRKKKREAKRHSALLRAMHDERDEREQDRAQASLDADKGDPEDPCEACTTASPQRECVPGCQHWPPYEDTGHKTRDLTITE